MSKNILVLQHIPIETPGYILDLMIADNMNITTIELDEGEKIPDDLDYFDAMFCMGGPMDTWMEESYPWLKEEKEKIKNYVVDLQKPYLGFCLGCQLLGEVVGGLVEKSNPPEIGILDVQMHKSHLSDPLFCDYNSNIKALQWHSYEVKRLENIQDVTLLASSNTTKYQIFKYRDNAYGIQFHIEIKNDTVSQWGCVPEYEKALNDTLGDGALNKFEIEAKSCMSDMNLNAEKLYKNFRKIL